MSIKKSEFEIVQEFTNKLGLKNKTDGSLFIYKAKSGMATKPDGYYYYDGITFILDAKAEGDAFIGQLEDYMKLEKNTNFIGFKYNGIEFQCFVNGTLQKNELVLQDKEYYKATYFNNINKNNSTIVSESAKKLASLFRDAKIDKQMNVPFIGAVMLCFKYGAIIDTTSTTSILSTTKIGINTVISESPLNRKQKKEFIKNCLDDASLKNSKDTDLFAIIQEISTIYNFINISIDDSEGHDIMNNFLHVFRKWNSANAKEKGEVFTPDHIAQLMYNLADCNKDCIVLDPTCGSGTFLTNSMANMLRETTDIFEKKNIIENNLIGVECDGFNATLAGINMMLHGDGASNIYYDDCFICVPRLQNCYNRVLMNPPFSVRDNELKFVYIALLNMQENGILSAILPKSCVKGTESNNLEYLEKIFKIASLKSVVSLPNDLFGRNAGVATCIVTFEKTNAPHLGNTILINCSDDGYVLKKSGDRIDANNKWKDIMNSVIDAKNGIFDSFRAVSKKLNYTDELLFEKYSSNRTYDIDSAVYSRYLRENISAKILCGWEQAPIIKEFDNIIVSSPKNYVKVKISDLIYMIEKGKTKSIDRKLEDKFPISGVPLIIAKKDNNGIGGKTLDFDKLYSDKFCIICGGDGGGGKTYYCDFEFAATNFVMICDLLDQYADIDKYAKFYLSVTISERLFKTIGHGRTISSVPDIDIMLPSTTNNEIDFEYMSNFIKTLPFGEHL